jgi:hypothetical protein
MVQLVGMILDFLDALAGAVTIACWWCTWIRPAKQPARPSSSKPAEFDLFICEAQARVVSPTMPIASGQRTGTSDAAPPT